LEGRPKPLKRPKKGILGTLWRDSEGVQRGSDSDLRKGWKGKEEFGGVKRGLREVERVKRPDLESWREAFEGWKNWRKGSRREKG